MSLLIKKTIKSMLLNQRQSYRTICDFIFIILTDSLLATEILFMHGPQFISFCLIFYYVIVKAPPFAHAH